MVYINVPFFFILTILLTLRMSLQSLGQKIVPLISSSLELLGKFIATLFLIPALGYFGVCLIEPITWGVCALWMVISYMMFLKKVH